MKCDKCYRKAEFGWDGEEAVYCSDHYNERSERKELIKELREVKSYRWLNEDERTTIQKAAELIEENS